MILTSVTLSEYESCPNQTIDITITFDIWTQRNLMREYGFDLTISGLTPYLQGELVQEHQDGGLPEVEEDVLPPPEQEREGGARPSSRNVSPLATYASLRSDRVCHLPVDRSLHLLSPRTKKKAQELRLAPHQEFMRSAIARSLAPSSSSPTPQARVGNFLEKILLGRK